MDLLDELDKLISRNNESSTGDNGVIPLDVLLRQPDGNNVTSIDVGGGHFVRSIPEVVAILVAYSIVIILSLFGNSLVCHVIYKNKRLHTVTNIFIANLSISDMVITVLNIPFNIMRNILEDWPFGTAMCVLVNFTLMASVYASTFTMAAIAMDRYIVIMYPLKPRITTSIGLVMVVVTWILATVMSLPFAIYAKVEKVELFLKSVDRCRLCYPQPDYVYERSITLFTFISQYVVPMVIIAIAYGQIVRKLWIRPMVGQATLNQQYTQYKIKRKTIRMLIVVVVIFCVCWMPLNLYHLLTDFHPNAAVFTYNSSVYLACHWFAMSSVCYNPFVYCWLNQHFREKIRNKFTWIYRRRSQVHPAVEVEGTLIRYDKFIKRKLLTNTRSQSSSSSGMKSGCGLQGQTRPKKLRTICDENPSPDNTEDKGSCNRLACLGGRNKSRHPKRVLFKEGANNLELCHMVCTTTSRTNSHLQRNNFGDYDFVASDSSNGNTNKDMQKI